MTTGGSGRSIMKQATQIIPTEDLARVKTLMTNLLHTKDMQS